MKLPPPCAQLHSAACAHDEQLRAGTRYSGARMGSQCGFHVHEPS